MLAQKDSLRVAFDPPRQIDHALPVPAVVIVICAATLLALAAFLPAGQIMPLLSLGSIGAALVVGAAALIAGRAGASHAPVARQLAGGFILVGMVSGMMSGSAGIVDLFSL